jgi:hypothetical protein
MAWPEFRWKVGVNIGHAQAEQLIPAVTRARQTYSLT